jgi:predicted membrane channel-forming protein YqfA (hemolysin III family)
MQKFQAKHYRPVRALLYSCLGLWGVVPCIHGWRLNAGVVEINRALLWDALMGVLYLVSGGWPRLTMPTCPPSCTASAPEESCIAANCVT